MRVRVSDGSTYTNRIFTIHVTDLNEVPSFSGPAIFTTPENNASATFQPTASDPDGNNLTYQISGGADQSKFDINASTGSITFKTTPDFENPSDANTDNAYRVRIRISDGAADANRIFTVHVTNLNETPTDLNSTATLSIAENQPVGTLVGQFTATDTDAGATLSYRLTGGQGSQHNDRFTLDANGTLRSAKVFDYENKQLLKIRVRVADEHNASLKQAFVVLVADVVEQNATNVPERFRPVVETRPAKDVAGTSATLRGKIEDNGGSAVTERGFLLSTRPNPKPGRPNVQRLDDANGSTNFRTDALGLEAGKKYFYRAFATNAKGTSLGPVETFTTTTATQGPSWINAQPGPASNWWTSDWFGNFFLNANGWARHVKLGWVFPVESPTAGLWLWKKDVGWLWTDKGIYPSSSMLPVAGSISSASTTAPFSFTITRPSAGSPTRTGSEDTAKKGICYYGRPPGPARVDRRSAGQRPDYRLARPLPLRRERVRHVRHGRDETVVGATWRRSPWHGGSCVLI